MQSFKTLLAVVCPFILAAAPAVLYAADAVPPAPVIKPIAAARPANSSPNYQALRSISASGEAFNIEGVTLKRDAAK